MLSGICINRGSLLHGNTEWRMNHGGD